jgi:hypothetical protein
VVQDSRGAALVKSELTNHPTKKPPAASRSLAQVVSEKSLLLRFLLMRVVSVPMDHYALRRSASQHTATGRAASQRNVSYSLKQKDTMFMNRRERRAQKAESRRQFRIVAIHEAGHAVGRVMTAKMMGLRYDEAIDYIRIGPDTSSHSISADGKVTLISQATTCGPEFCSPMKEYMEANPAPLANLSSDGALKNDVARCKEAGIDVENWARANALICMFGPVAEAIYTGRDTWSVITCYACQSDYEYAVGYCALAGIPEGDIRAIVVWAAETASQMLAAKDAWMSVLELANSLPSSGRLDGKRAAEIICRTLGWVEQQEAMSLAGLVPGVVGAHTRRAEAAHAANDNALFVESA